MRSRQSCPGRGRDKLAAILTDEDVATTQASRRNGDGREYAESPDLRSRLSSEAWALAATSIPLPWPAPEALVLKFVAHHLWDPGRSARRIATTACRIRSRRIFICGAS